MTKAKTYPRVVWEGRCDSVKLRVVMLSERAAITEQIETDAMGGIRWVQAGSRWGGDAVINGLTKAVCELAQLAEDAIKALPPSTALPKNVEAVEVQRPLAPDYVHQPKPEGAS